MLLYQSDRYGEMSEWSMVTVLKTVVRKHRGFESLSLRHFSPQWCEVFKFIYTLIFGMEKYSSGRRGAPAKGVGVLKRARVQIPPSPPIRSLVSSMDARLFYCSFISCFPFAE